MGGTRRGGWDVNVYDIDFGVPPDDSDAEMFGPAVTGEERIGGEFGELNGMVDKGEQTPNPSAPRAVTSDRCVPGETAESGGLGELGFLDTRNLYAPVE